MVFDSSLRDLTRLLLDGQDNDPRTVERCLEKALLIELPSYSAARILAPYGWTHPRHSIVPGEN